MSLYNVGCSLGKFLFSGDNFLYELNYCWAIFYSNRVATLGLGLAVVRDWAQAQRLNGRLTLKQSPELFSWAWGQAQR